jgi:hypothetical protein
VSHNTKIKSKERKQTIKTPTSLSRTQFHSTKWSNGKEKKGWKTCFSKKNSIEDSVGNEENG